jgi:uncharacterized protein YbjT (DUF2867 family)
MNANQTVLVTGATGYIGGRLIRPLLKAGYRVRVVTRNLNHLQGRSWLSEVEAMQGNVLDAAGLRSILDGVDVAFYLIHSMGDTGAFVERDMLAAGNFAKAAADAGVRQIIYLGGLGQANDKLSRHLSSRQKVGEILRAHHSGVTEFRAAMVVGAGSLSFEIVRNLTERLPIMIAPKWLYTRSQPIAIADVLTYLMVAIDRTEAFGAIIEIGGADVLTYHDMILHYARARGLRRLVIPVPVLTPHLSSYWVHMVTPVSASIVRPLIQGLVNEMIVTQESAARLFPEIQPQDFETGLHAALDELDARQVETSWTDSMSATWEQDEPYTFVEERGMLIERRVRQVNAPPAALYQTFTSLGGETGWLYLNFLWHLRGWMDRIVGGPGYRRGRPQREVLRIGDAVDFWRVEAIEPDHMLRLRAEMKLPGKGWLQFEVDRAKDGSSRLVQTAYFAPHGLSGYVYWYAIFFLHRLIFDGLVNRVVSAAEHGSGGQGSAAT